MRTGFARELSDILGDKLTYLATFVAAMDAGSYDLLLCPATPIAAAWHGLTKQVLPDVSAPSVLLTMLGVPAGAVPVTRVRPGEESDRPESRDVARKAARTVEQGSTGLPVGVQVAARHWREDVVLAAMQAIETAASSHSDHPAVPPR